MFNGRRNDLTDPARFFLEPSSPTHRQYEALRAFFVEGLPSAEAARRFGYTEGSFRVLCSHFRKDPRREFFRVPTQGPKSAPKRDALRDEVVGLRKQNLSVYDISRTLDHEGRTISPAAVSLILKEEGFARLPRRRDDERPAGVRAEAAPVADVRTLDLSPRRFRTKFGGLFLFLPFLAELPFDALMEQAGLPGSQMIPAACALRSLLALKLWGNARHSHIMTDVMDQGLAVVAAAHRPHCARCLPSWQILGKAPQIAVTSLHVSAD